MIMAPPESLPPRSTPASSTRPTVSLHSTPIALAMFLQRSAVAAARRAAPRVVARRTFVSSFVRRTQRHSSGITTHHR
jgi:hypothetical protein